MSHPFDLRILAAGRGGLLEEPRINGTVNRIRRARAAADVPPERFRRIRYAVRRRFYASTITSGADAQECGEIAGRHRPGLSRRRGRFEYGRVEEGFTVRAIAAQGPPCSCYRALHDAGCPACPVRPGAHASKSRREHRPLHGACPATLQYCCWLRPADAS